jgi:hypothetical protein
MTARNLLFLYGAALAATYAALQAGNYVFATSPHFLVYSPAHFLGGVSVGIFVRYVCSVAGMRLRLLYFVIAILVIGTAWELWEYGLGLTEYPADSIDALSDYMMDILGAVLAYRFLRYHPHI